MTKLLVLYVFHIYNDNVKHFIEKCVFLDENVDFIIISNDKNNQFETPDYVKTLFRENIGYDFGGWSDALLTENLYKKYDNFIFVNSSVIGPFFPSYYKDKWTDIYINGLQNNVKLFGSTINTCKDPLNNSHVQSYIFSMDKTTLEYLINCNIFSITNYANTFKDAICNKEKLMSREIIKTWRSNKLNENKAIKFYSGNLYSVNKINNLTKQALENRISVLVDGEFPNNNYRKFIDFNILYYNIVNG